MKARYALIKQRRKPPTGVPCPACEGSGVKKEVVTNREPTIRIPPGLEIPVLKRDPQEDDTPSSSEEEKKEITYEEETEPLLGENTIGESVQEEEKKEISSGEEEKIVNTLFPTAEVTLETVQAQLAIATAEIARLKQVITSQTNKGMVITVPMPTFNAAGLTTQAEQQAAQYLCLDTVLKLITTVRDNFEAHNRKTYDFYTLEKNQELQMTFAETS